MTNATTIDFTTPPNTILLNPVVLTTVSICQSSFSYMYITIQYICLNTTRELAPIPQRNRDIMCGATRGVASLELSKGGTRGSQRQSLWGSGSYFARDAKYVGEGGFCKPEKDGSNRLVACCVPRVVRYL